MHSRVEQRRIEYIDIAKAVAMICVVTCHVMLYDFYGFQYSKEKSCLHQFVASFQMPLWFFLSGMVSRTTINVKEIPYDMYKRFRCLIVPALVVGIPFSYLLGRDIVAFFADGMKLGYWYMFVLFLLLIFNYIFSLPWGTKTKVLLYFFCSISWVVLYRHLYLIPQKINGLFCVDLFVRFVPYFVLGNIVKKLNLSKYLFNKKILTASLFIWIGSSTPPPCILLK